MFSAVRLRKGGCATASRLAMERFKEGCSEAVADIYRTFRKPILRYVSDKVRDGELAEDLTQEIFLKAYRARESYDPTYAFSTWLWTIARNTVFDWKRKKDPVSSSVYDDGDSDGEAPWESIPCTQATAERLMSDKIERRRLIRLLKSLTGLQRRVLWLRVIHQLSYQEIAEKLGVSLSAVKSLIHRAKETLIHEFDGGFAFA